MRVVVDTNVLISGIFWKGASQEILEFWLHGQLSFLTTSSILFEYHDVIRRMTKQGKENVFEKWSRSLTELSEIVEEGRVSVFCRDPDDIKFL